MTTSELGDVTALRERDLSLAQRELAGESAGLEMQDRLNRLAGVSGAGSAIHGQDLGGYQASTQARLQAAQLGLQGAMGEAGLQSGIDRMRYNADLTNRQLQAGERDYQHGLSRESIQDRINQRLMEEQFRGGAHNRQMDRFRLGSQVGFGQDPGRYEVAGANYAAGNAANYGGAAAGLAEVLARRRAGTSP
jgi:hypothetical protein